MGVSPPRCMRRRLLTIRWSDQRADELQRMPPCPARGKKVIEAEVLGIASSNGPYGERALGRWRPSYPIPAIVNAIYDAMGGVYELPSLPRRCCGHSKRSALPPRRARSSRSAVEPGFASAAIRRGRTRRMMRGAVIGVPKEVKTDEYRVALTPAGVRGAREPRPRGRGCRAQRGRSDRPRIGDDETTRQPEQRSSSSADEEFIQRRQG